MYTIDILGTTFTYRGVTRAELEQLRYLYPNSMDLEDALVATCVVDAPEDFDFSTAPAGYTSQLAQKILDMAGLGDLEAQIKMLQHAREKARSAESAFDLMIMCAFPAYKLSDLKMLSPEDYFDLIAKSERALIEFGRLDPEELNAIITGRPIQPQQPQGKRQPPQLTSPRI